MTGREKKTAQIDMYEIIFESGKGAVLESARVMRILDQEGHRMDSLGRRGIDISALHGTLLSPPDRNLEAGTNWDSEDWQLMIE